MPYISAPYRKYNWAQRLRSSIMQIPLPDTGDSFIDLAPWPECFAEDGTVKLTDTGRPEAEKMRKMTIKPDIVIYATGYTQEFPFLGKDYPLSEDADVRRIWKSGDKSVGFIGFVRPSLGKLLDVHTHRSLMLMLRQGPFLLSLSFKLNSGSKLYSIAFPIHFIVSTTIRSFTIPTSGSSMGLIMEHAPTNSPLIVGVPQLLLKHCHSAGE